MNKELFDPLRENGTLLPDGTIHKDKINLISGAHTPTFAETVWALTDKDGGTLNRLTNLFAQLYSGGRENELLEIIRILYDVVGLQFPQDFEGFSGHPEAQQYFLFEFLLDLNDVTQELLAETQTQPNVLSGR